MPRPNKTLPLPDDVQRLRLVVDAAILPQLDQVAAELRLSVSSLCRLLVEMAARRQLPLAAVQAEAAARRPAPAAAPPAPRRPVGRPRKKEAK